MRTHVRMARGRMRELGAGSIATTRRRARPERSRVRPHDASEPRRPTGRRPPPDHTERSDPRNGLDDSIPAGPSTPGAIAARRRRAMDMTDPAYVSRVRIERLGGPQRLAYL